MQTETSTDSTAASVPVSNNQDSNIEATAPGQLRVIKRNGSIVSYDESKIAIEAHPGTATSEITA